ncbi:uncharacterized protein Bfra_003810 [Botrytis fragariae]|uniref:Uncharacterized protein n=1 Tax=Botrytis fragariae TaxID=1964551 RepID=A0A8H6EKA3_9HELO|nr:uncharacterized protein Bfra_003810 [Botrytis fragariae]KAF5875356.1 hypothetical protein Bfra_003810 [Botrytis fragariae]
MRDITPNASKGLFHLTHGGIAGIRPLKCLEGTRVHYDERKGGMYLLTILRIAIHLRGFEGKKSVAEASLAHPLAENGNTGKWFRNDQYGGFR